MARHPGYTKDQILDAAVHAAHRHWRSATVAHVTGLLGAPSGSIYYRFPSREALFASAWIRSVHHFHRRLAAVTAADPVEAIVETALLIPRFCREHPMEARTLTMYRYVDLVADPPTDLGPELQNLNDPVRETLVRLTQARYGRLTPRGVELVSLAVRDAPMGMIRPLIGSEIPVWMDDAVRAASTALAHLDDALT